MIVVALLNVAFLAEAEIRLDSNTETSILNPLWRIEMGGNVESISFSGDDKYLIVGTGLSKKGPDNKIYFFKLLQGTTPLWTYQCDASVREVSISVNGSHVVAGTEDGHVYLFEKSGGEPVWVYNTPEMVDALAISRDGNYVVVGTGNWGGNGGKIYFFHRANGIPLWVYQTKSFNGQAWVEDVAISSSGNYIAVGAHDGMHILDRRGDLLFHYDTGSWILSVSMSLNGSYVVAGTFGGDVYFFHSFSELLVWSYHSEGAIWSTDISSTGEYVVVGDMGAFPTVNSTIILFGNEDSVPLWKYYTTTQQGPIYVSISLNGYIAAGTADHAIYYFENSSSQPLWIYETQSEIRSVDISSYGNYVVAGTKGSLHQYLYLFHYKTVMKFLLYGISIVNDSFGFAVGTEGVIIEYIDGRWYFVGSPTSNALNGISLINETYGFAVGLNGTILFFNGMLWQHYCSPTTKHLFDVSMIDSVFGFAVGHGLYKFDGESWIIDESIYGEAIAFGGRNFGVIVGDSSSYVYNGVNWSDIPVDPAREIQLYDVCVVGDSLAFAIGLDLCAGPGVLYRYHNGSWSKMADLWGGCPTSISMFNETRGIVAGYDVHGKGLIWKYDGSSWTREDVPEVEILREVLLLDHNKAFAVGDAGAILRYNGVSWIIDGILEDNVPPSIHVPWYEPEIVLPDDTVTVSVNVTDAESGVSEVILSYSTDNGVNWVNVTIGKATGDTYVGEIPSFPNGTSVEYKVITYDRAGNVVVNDNEGYNFTYTVIPEFSSWLLLLLTLFMLTLILIYARRNAFRRFRRPRLNVCG